VKKIIVIALVAIGYANAWEVNTHRAIDKEASSIATNLNTFMDDAKLDKIESYENKYDSRSHPFSVGIHTRVTIAR